MDKIRIIMLGGQDEAFKNMVAIEINNDIFVIEAGFTLPDKTQPGVDFIIPRYDYLIENKEKVRGYFLTHGYDSVMGALPYIYEKVPAQIYCSSMTANALYGFCLHNNLAFEKLAISRVKVDDDIKIGNRLISFFGVTSNFAESFGVCIDTNQGNVIYLPNAVAHNDFEPGFTPSKQKIARITSNKTLVLLIESFNSDKPGYCSPNYKLLQVLKNDIFDSTGRIFLAIDWPNLFNIIDCLNLAMARGRKIIPYDSTGKEVIAGLIKEGYLKVQRDSISSIEEVNRLRPQDVLVFITGFGKRLLDKIALLATKNNDEKIVFLTKNDTFVFGVHVMPETETAATDTIDELYRTDCTVLRPRPKEYLRMHGCEEDIKYFIASFRPAYLIPVSAPFVKLLACAKIALNMNVGLNHNNVYIVDNGNVIEFEAGIGRISSSKVVAGDILIDGKGNGDINALVLEERHRFADEGVIVLGVTISKDKHEIVAGPDVQARGLVFLKENEALIREITRLFVSTVQNELAKENYSIAYMENAVKDIVFKAIRRALNKTPTVIPVIAEIN